MKQRLTAERKMLNELLRKERVNEDFVEKRARDFKREPYEFLRGYCDKLNIWEEGALLIRERLSEIRESRHLTKELKVILEKVESELLKENWMNIPKHPNYDKDLRKFLRLLRDSHPHLNVMAV